MNERTIELTDISPKDFWGIHDLNLNIIKKFFPKLKIISRDSVLKIFGEEDVLDEFEKRFYKLMTHYSRYNAIDANVIDRIMLDDRKDPELPDNDKILVYGVGGKIIKPITVNQHLLVEMMSKNDMIFAVGPAGTGKTYTGVAMAIKALKEKQVKRIILTRPAVEAGENLGFLPGDMKEKLDPYMQPLYDALRDMLPHEKLEDYLLKKTIQIAPLAFMRGRTLDDAFVILDEAQNCTSSQMKMFLTRMGKNAKFMITGDPGQVDLPKKAVSGLKEAINILKDIDGIGIIYLNNQDVIRHHLVKKVIEAYERREEE